MLAARSVCVHCQKVFRSFRYVAAEQINLGQQTSFGGHSHLAGAIPSCHQPSRWLATENIFMPATFAHLDIAEQAPVINAYTTNGFIIRGNRVYGSVALLPRGMLHWRLSKVEEITPESFALFHLVEPKIDLVVLGTGVRVQRINKSVTDYLKRKGITLEIQDTPNACATFNFLLDEGRPAGAALLPPEYIPP